MRTVFMRSDALVLVAAFLVVLPGCYGSFELVKKVYKFNGSLGDKFVNEIGFIVMTVIPIYGGAAFIDALILNSIEFWTGSNPVASNLRPGEFVVPGEQMAILMDSQAGSYRFTQMIGGREVAVTVEMLPGGSVAKDAEGTILARCIPNAGGGVTIYDGAGNITGALTRAQIDALVAAH